MTTDREPATAAMPRPFIPLRVCDDLIAWYGTYAVRARDAPDPRDRAADRRRSISVAALAWPGSGVPAAVLGGIVVVLTGLRQIFHWQENYAIHVGVRDAEGRNVGGTTSVSLRTRSGATRPEAHGRCGRR